MHDTLFPQPRPLPPAPPGSRWTPAQWRGIATTGRSLLVSAAAGSGKTAVLAERCAYLVCDADDPCDVDELLVVTFTEAAAAEMKTRIGKALRDRAAKTPSDRLAHQLALLDRASISTLHGFCSRLLRQHFHLVGLDPAFGVLDADDAKLLRNDVARQLFADRYELDDGGEFSRLVDAYADGDDTRLARLVIAAHEMLASLVDGDAWVERSLRRIREAAAAPKLEEMDLGGELREFLAAGLAGIAARCDAAIRLLTGEFAGGGTSGPVPPLPPGEGGGAGTPKRRTARSAGAAAPASPFAKYLDLLREHRSTLYLWEKKLAEAGVDGLAAEVATFVPGKLPPVKNDVPNKDAAKAAVDAVRDAMKAGPWRDCLRFTTAEWRDGLKAILPHAETFAGLVRQFGDRYRGMKDAARSIDFSDLERFALKALRDPSTPAALAPSAAARACHRRYRHVLVDEYQDINEVQDAILTLVSRESLRGEPGVEANLFSVGDVKQSIYRFRLAEPTRFLERERSFRGTGAALPLSPVLTGEGPGEGLKSPSTVASDDALGSSPSPQPASPGTGERGPWGEVIDLQANFRSRAPLLAAVNAVFERLMTADATDITYDASHKLHPGRQFPDAPAGTCTFTGAPIELHLLPKKLDADDGDEGGGECNGEDAADLDRAEREALLVARRIREMMGLEGGPPMCVAERRPDGSEGHRPMRFGDVVVLLRSMKHKADEYAEVLEAAGVPVHSESSSGYFESMEVRDVLALLALLDNGRQDVPLAAVLRSPIAALPRAEDALAEIRAAYPPGGDGPAFHEAARRYAAERDDDLARWLRDFFAKLSRWRSLAQRRPLADLVAAVYDETGYLAYAGGLHNGRQRVANLMYLRERAAQFGTFHRQGLSRFLHFLDSLREESDLGQPSVAAEAEDVVRIMSVHRSKGLEFPVVFLPDLGKAINLQDCSGSVLLDRRAGLGMAVVDEHKRVRYPSLASTLVQGRLRQQALAEEMRVLYVAMTRAQEHLVLLGTTGSESPARWAARWKNHRGPLPADAVLGAATMLDWVGPVAAATGAPDRSDVFLMVRHEAADVAQWRHPSARSAAPGERLARLARLEPLDPPPAPHPLADDVARRLTARYPFEPFTRVAAARPMAEAPGGRKAAAALAKSPLLAGAAPPTGDEIGTATHRVLQHLDFRRPCDAADVAAQVQELVDRRLLTATEAARVDLPSLEWLMASEVGSFLREHAAALRRELPVYAAAPAGIEEAPAAGADQVMLRGRIDALVPLPDRSVVIDYKTDAVDAAAAPARAQLYAPQSAAYADAVARMTGKPVEVLLVFLRARAVHRSLLPVGGARS